MDRDEAIRLATAAAGDDRSRPNGSAFGWRFKAARLVETSSPGVAMLPPYWAVEFDETLIEPGGGERPTRHGGLCVQVSCRTGETQCWNAL